MLQTFSTETFHSICDDLAKKDDDLSHIIKEHGYPPMWTRSNSFETLVHIILEQQVSLASAMAALVKLKEHTKGITPKAILKMSDDEMRACYVSRQKMIYIRGLAQALNEGLLDLLEMQQMPDDAIRQKLTALKGIGNWTTDVYLMFVLQRSDLFPIGDLAAVNALKRAKRLDADVSKEEMTLIAEKWKPYRTIATMILWHHYLSSPIKKQK